MASILLALTLASFSCIHSLEIWDLFETSVVGPSSGNPFKEIEVSATFISPSKVQTTVTGFYNGDGVYSFRFMPNEVGSYTYFTNSNSPNVEDKTGSFKVSNATGNNRGPVYAVNDVDITKQRPYFRYAQDGGVYFECGTTSYGWIELAASQSQQTIKTLNTTANAHIFNKLRMAIFPLVSEYTHLQPVSFPFTGEKSNQWNNFSAFNLSFWSQLDTYLQQLQAMNIIVDLILFHPYDHGEWGFDCMGGSDAATYDVSNDLFYLKYVVSRLAAYRNVWWSMANEYDLIQCKDTGIPNNYSIWDTYFERLVEYDPYRKPEKEKSIHNAQKLYNYSQPFTTHFSVQGYENVDYTYFYDKFGVTKPVILDEVQYEGNTSSDSLTAFQELDRFWQAAANGMQAGHSENFAGNPNGTSITWWNYGVALQGQSWSKIGWYYAFMMNETVHPPFHELFTYCYVNAVYNAWQSDYVNITDACYVSQLYDKKNAEYYLVRWANISNDASNINFEYNKTVEIKLDQGEYKMYEIQIWNEQIVLLDDTVKIVDNEGYAYTAKQTPYILQFINKKSKYNV